MQILNGQDEFYIKEGCAVTIGKFDGVHKGHVKLIKDCVSRAKVSGIKSCVITFLSQDEEEKHLTTFDEKKKLIEELGADMLLTFTLDETFMKLNPYAFIDSVLVDKLNMQSVSVGPDFRFGHKRDGKVMTFVKAAMIYGYGVNVIDKEEYKEKPISSTRIREKIAEGDLEAAAEMLGRAYFVSGVTKKGAQIGRTIGFPTMNIYPDKDKLLPPFGVYSGDVLIGGKTYSSVTNVGVRPTVNDDKENVSVESHLLDFKSYGENAYDKDIVVSFNKKMRDEMKFASREELARQIEKDIKEVS